MESLSNYPKVMSRVKWQWKSNSDPWSKSEEPQWTSYSPEHNYLIEKAYHDQKKEVDIGEYIISIQHTIQKRKGVIISQRPIRRRVCERDEIDARSERYFETELPKTINNVFGNLKHFISFFSRRNPEILNLAKQFEESEQANDLEGLNTNIRLQLICYLELELLKPIEHQLQDHSISEIQKKIMLKTKRRHEELTSLFGKEFGSFEEFYGSILKSYTMNTELFMNLNKYLRNESWSDVDNLLLYAICLCKAFFSLKREENKLQKTEVSMILYRGTALDELALSSYKVGVTPKIFSWNAVTSTSTNKKMAEIFMYSSANIEKKIYPVMFIIEIPFTNKSLESEYLRWIDVHQYSTQPKEDEVILPPGSVFELEQTEIDQEQRTIIKIKLKHEVESLAHGGLIMQGALQTAMMSDKQIKIISLKEEELNETLKSISGNKLIEDIEFSLCTFNNRFLKKMLYVLPTLDKVKGLRFSSCKYEDKQGISSMKLQNVNACNILTVQISGYPSFYKIFEGDSHYWTSWKNLNLDFRNLRNLEAQDANNFLLHKLQHFTHLISLDLNFPNDQEIAGNVNYSLFQGLKHLIQLTSLNLDFSYCSKITEIGVNNLASQALKYLTQLTSLSLSFYKCQQISSLEVTDLTSQGLKYLTQLTSLTLDFSYCADLTDCGVDDLASQGLRDLTKLTSLNLNFSWCWRITEKGVENLVFQGLKYLTQLTSLSLDFSYCSRIRNEKMANLIYEGFVLQSAPTLIDNVTSFQELPNPTYEKLKHLTKFTSLILNKKVIKQACPQDQTNEDQDEKNKNLMFLKLIRRKDDTQMKSDKDNQQELALFSENNFSKIPPPSQSFILSLLIELMNPWLITNSLPLSNSILPNVMTWPEDDSDENISASSNSTSQIFFQSCHSTSITLDFSYCSKVTNEGMRNMAYQGLKYLTRLTSLSLNFSSCKNITDEGVNNLASQGLKFLTQLTSLTLDFSDCINITDEGVNNLASQGLKYLTQLSSLTLNFWNCAEITDRGMNNLASNGLGFLTKLTSATLNFSRCIQITDEGINNLIYQIRHLAQLLSLTLYFSNCRISQSTFESIVRVLRYFGFIEREIQNNY